MRQEEDFNGMANETLVRTITGAQVATEATLAELSNMTIEELTSIKGIGKATAKKLLAAFELGRRLLAEKECKKYCGCSLDIYQHLRPMMEKRDVELAYLVVMGHNFRILKTVKLSEGGLTETAVDVRVIMRHVVSCNGTVIALAHNHPSGSLQPSKNDDILTQNVNKACGVMRVHLMDHIIIGGGNYYSYYDKGRL